MQSTRLYKASNEIHLYVVLATNPLLSELYVWRYVLSVPARSTAMWAQLELTDNEKAKKFQKRERAFNI